MTEFKSNNASNNLSGQNSPQNETSHAAFESKARQSLASFFRDHRKNAGLTLESVALALGYESIETVVAYETGSTAVPLEDIFALTNLMNIAPEEVLGLVYDMSLDLNSENDSLK